MGKGNKMAITKFKRRDELEDEIEELKLKISEYDRLHGELNDILHPNGDKPSNPSLCDLVAYVQHDLKKLKKEAEHWKKSFDNLIEKRGGYQPIKGFDGEPLPPPREE